MMMNPFAVKTLALLIGLSLCTSSFCFAQNREPPSESSLLARIKALGDIGDAKAIPHLKKFLSSRFPKIRLAASFALAKLHDPSAVQGMISALKSTDASVRTNAAGFLGDFGVISPKALIPLIECLQDANASVQLNAAASLRHYNDPRKVIPLIHTLRAGDDSISSNASGSLTGFYRSNAAVITFERLWSQVENTQWRVWGAFGIVIGFQTKRAFQNLIDWTRNKDPNIRANAITAIRLLHLIEDERRLEVLLRAMKDESEDVRARSAEGLGCFNNQRSVDALVEALGDSSKKVTLVVLRQMWILQNVHFVRPLIELLKKNSICLDVHCALSRITGYRIGFIGGPTHMHSQWLKWYESEGYKTFPAKK
jgi:HEAT repeat protein